MREVSTPALPSLADDADLAAVVWSNAERAPDFECMRYREGDTWVAVTARDLADLVLSVAKGLIASGVGPGERVAMLSSTRFEWPVIEYAVWAVGGATVSLYDLWSTSQVARALADCEPSALVVETAEHRRTVGQAVDSFEVNGRLWQIEPSPDGVSGGALAELAARGAHLDDEAVWERSRNVASDDRAALIYTAGTTTRAKACVLTHRNLLSETAALRTVAPHYMTAGNSMLLFLPLAHVFARSMQCAAIEAGVTVGYSPGPDRLLSDLAGFEPSFILAVPAVFDKIRKGVLASARSPMRRWTAQAADSAALAWSLARDAGRPGTILRARRAVFDRLVYRRLRGSFGRRCIGAVCGGGRLEPELGHYFRGVGVPIIEGYGLTESCGGATANSASATKFGTVGRPFAGVSVRIAEDGEVLLRGPVVFAGYWNDEESTRAVLDDGWLRTGDTGTLDDDGFLSLTGNTKDMLVTTAAENVAYLELEKRLRTHPLLRQCMVVGHERPFAAALVTLEPDAVRDWLRDHGRTAQADLGDLADDKELHADIQLAVDDANAVLTTAHGIKKFRLLPTDFTQEREELCSDGELCRETVLENRRDDIEALYS